MATGGRLDAFNALENDTVAPSSAADLSASALSSTRAQVRWTATGDDGTQGTASGYNLRWSDKPISAKGGDNAIRFDDAMEVETGAPKASGAAEQVSFSVSPAGHERTIYVALQVTDNVGNASDLTLTTVKVPAANVAFEGNAAGNWTADDPWVLADGVWSSNSTGQQANNSNVSLTSRPIDLSKTKASALYFTSQYDLEPGYDFASVEVSADGGGSWANLARNTGATDLPS